MSINNWYYIDNDSEDAKELLTMFWDFHDFRIREVHCFPKDNTVDLYLEYDSDGICVLLRFQDVQKMQYVPVDDFDAVWMFGALLYVDEGSSIVWVASDDFDENETLPLDITWIKARKLMYAMVDANNNPIAIPDTIQDQVLNAYNCETHQYDKLEQHFNPKRVL